MAEESGAASGLGRRLQLRRSSMGVEGANPRGKQQTKEYSEILIAHLRENGQIICITDDNDFADTLRDLFSNDLKMPATGLNITSQAEKVARLARKAVEIHESPLILIDQNIYGHDLSFVTRIVKTAFPELKILMLAQEADRDHFALMHESGVDAFLIKPLDRSGLLEKLALALKPVDQVDRSLAWAKSLMDKGDYIRALQVANQALEQQSNTSAALILVGDIFRAMKEYDKAAESYIRASGGSALYLEPLGKLVELYSERGDIVKKLRYLEKMDEVSPLNLERKIQIGELMLKLNRADKARNMFEQVMKLSHRHARENVACVAYRVADVYTDTDPKTAASFLRQGLKMRKGFWGREDIATFNRLGLLLRRAGLWHEAVDEYKRALSVAANDDVLHYNLSMAYLEGRDLENARAMALKAMALNPELPRRSSRIASNIAAVFMSTNDKMHALPLLRIALELDPDNAEARDLKKKAEAQDGQA